MASGIDRLRRLPTTEGPCERWRRLLSDASVAGLHAFVYWFSLPARLFGRIAETPILALSDWRLLAAYHPGGLLESALAMVVGQVAGDHSAPVLGLRERRSHRLVLSHDPPRPRALPSGPVLSARGTHSIVISAAGYTPSRLSRSSWSEWSACASPLQAIEPLLMT